MSPSTPITLRVFVSSPGDVAEERFLCEKVLARLGDRYRRVCVIEPIFWEHEPLLATATFQTQLPSPADTDIVICVLWSRIGTRLPPGEGLPRNSLSAPTPRSSSSTAQPAPKVPSPVGEREQKLANTDV